MSDDRIRHLEERREEVLAWWEEVLAAMSQCRTPADEDEFDILVGYCDAFRDEGNRINGLIDRMR